VKAFALVKTIRNSLQTLLLHQLFTETARDFFKAVRSGNYGEAKSKMSPAWQGVSTGELREMIQNDLPLRRSRRRHISAWPWIRNERRAGRLPVFRRRTLDLVRHQFDAGRGTVEHRRAQSATGGLVARKLQQQPDLESRSVDMPARLAG
jgi:hypothetical protein